MSFCADPFQPRRAVTSGPTTGEIAISASSRSSIRIARERDGGRPHLPRIVQSADHIGRAPAHRDADDHVLRAQRPRDEIAPALGGIVLGAFDRIAQRMVAAGDDADDHRVRHPERGRALRGIEHAEPPAGAGAHIDEPAARLERRDDLVHRRADRGQDLLHRHRHVAVFAVDGGEDIPGRHEVDLHRAGIARLRNQRPQFRDQPVLRHRYLPDLRRVSGRNEYSFCQRRSE